MQDITRHRGVRTMLESPGSAAQRRPHDRRPGRLLVTVRPTSSRRVAGIHADHKDGGAVLQCGIQSPDRPTARIATPSPRCHWLPSVTESVCAPASEPESSMTRTNRPPLQERLLLEARRLLDEAMKLPRGPLREALLREGRLHETASHIDQWLSSPGLRVPAPTTA